MLICRHLDLIVSPVDEAKKDVFTFSSCDYGGYDVAVRSVRKKDYSREIMNCSSSDVCVCEDEIVSEIKVSSGLKVA